MLRVAGGGSPAILLDLGCSGERHGSEGAVVVLGLPWEIHGFCYAPGVCNIFFGLKVKTEEKEKRNLNLKDVVVTISS